MFKNILIACICLLSTELHAGKKGNPPQTTPKGSFEVWLGSGDVIGTLQSLDFSNENPELKSLCFANSSDAIYQFAKDDLGLKNNIYLQSVYCGSPEYQIPISMTYLPLVEFYSVNWDYQNLRYLSSAFPSLKTLVISNPGGEDYAKLFENLSRLELLEKVEFRDWGRARTLTDEEIFYISQIPNLKLLKIKMGGSYTPIGFDQKALDTLQSLRPDLKVDPSYTLWFD